MLDKQFMVLYYEITTATYCQLTTWFPLSEDFKKLPCNGRVLIPGEQLI